MWPFAKRLGSTPQGRNRPWFFGPHSTPTSMIYAETGHLPATFFTFSTRWSTGNSPYLLSVNGPRATSEPLQPASATESVGARRTSSASDLYRRISRSAGQQVTWPRWLVSYGGSREDPKMTSAQDPLYAPISIPDDANHPFALVVSGWFHERHQPPSSCGFTSRSTR
jgi:hypothetical protein